MNRSEIYKMLYRNQAYSEFDTVSCDTLIQELKSKLNYAEEIRPEFLNILTEITLKYPGEFWRNDVKEATVTGLENLYKENSDKIKIDEKIMEYFYMAFATYGQVTDIIVDLEKTIDDTITKNRLYRIPTYVNLMEGCLTNLYKIIVLIINFTVEKDYSNQRMLNPLCDVLRSNGFELLQKEIDVDIRNAINHGGVLFKENGREIIFHYTNKGSLDQKILKTYEFDKLINKVYDISSGILLGITLFLNKNFDEIEPIPDNTYVSNTMLAQKLYVPGVKCQAIYESQEPGQLNIELEFERIENRYCRQTTMLVAMQVYEKYPEYEYYWIGIQNSRLKASWVRFKREEIEMAMSTEEDSFPNAINAMLERGDEVLFEPSNEMIDLEEIKYYKYPQFNSDAYKIRAVKDCSLRDRKRIRAHLFVGDIEKREDVLNIIDKAILWLANIKNIADPKDIIKHGTMEADSVYLNVYKEDGRKSKELLPNNDNFICFVDYNINGETVLKNGGISPNLWKQLKHEKRGKQFIAWSKNDFAKSNLVNKKLVGRNSPCPCGSGKKFKNCCIDKEYYD